MTTPPIGLTMGDPAGIGPETIARLFAEGAPANCLVIGDAAILRRAVRLVGAELAIRAISAPQQASFAPRGIDLIDVGRQLDELPFGRPDPRAGAASFAYVEHAIAATLKGELAAIVTAPISKAAWHAAGLAFPGHTELLATRAGVADYAMMMASPKLRVVLVSIHVSLAEAVRAVTPAAELRAIRLADAALRRAGVAQPRVAVAGLNPHAGEEGHFGREEIEIIAPAIAQARAEGIGVCGPYPGDTVFLRTREGEFDVVVAQYHDQGLIPVKYLGLDEGVNVTLGLPFVRTSPDHGTAFDIAGTGRARATSLRRAVEMAAEMIGRG